MSKKPTELEAAALTSWTPAHQAALYHIHLAQQAEKDEAEAEKEKKKAEKKLREEIRPEEVQVGVMVDEWIKKYNPPLFDFLDIFAPPHLSIGLFILVHVLYWYASPWYFHFTLSWPTTFFIPMYCTVRSVTSKPKDRVVWLAYWTILALVAYAELWMVRDPSRSLRLWPKMKAVACVLLYSAVDATPGSKSRGTEPEPIYGAVKLFQRIVPEPAKSEDGEKDKGKGQDQDKSKDKDKAKSSSEKKSSRSSSQGKEKSSGRGSSSKGEKQEKK